ncbi:MAG: hypothetical protein ACK5KO_06060, partial [Arachnia sp.]
PCWPPPAPDATSTGFPSSNLPSLTRIDTTLSPRLTGADVIDAAGIPPQDLRLRMCGSAAMVGDIYGQLVAAGVPQANLEVEPFAFR